MGHLTVVPYNEIKQKYEYDYIASKKLLSHEDLEILSHWAYAYYIEAYIKPRPSTRHFRLKTEYKKATACIQGRIFECDFSYLK